MSFSIDINCDLGEGKGNEKNLMPLISSCNIACGGHAGDKSTMRSVMQLAKEHKVKIGAHPSYPDKENFGRYSMNISESKLIQSIQDQLYDFNNIRESKKISLNHIKPHGALYNDIAKDLKLAKVFLKAIESYKQVVVIYVPFGSIIEKEATEQGFQIMREAFADRNYNIDLSLVSRKLPNALIHDPKKVLDHVLKMTKRKRVKVINGEEVEILAETYCIHGDTGSALKILNYLSAELPKYGINIEK